eukprot:COSAG02_NODE_26661_length_628_cov_0.606805_1_plen_72_part_00
MYPRGARDHFARGMRDSVEGEGDGDGAMVTVKIKSSQVKCIYMGTHQLFPAPVLATAVMSVLPFAMQIVWF